MLFRSIVRPVERRDERNKLRFRFRKRIAEPSKSNKTQKSKNRSSRTISSSGDLVMPVMPVVSPRGFHFPRPAPRPPFGSSGTVDLAPKLSYASLYALSFLSLRRSPHSRSYVSPSLSLKILTLMLLMVTSVLLASPRLTTIHTIHPLSPLVVIPYRIIRAPYPTDRLAVPLYRCTAAHSTVPYRIRRTPITMYTCPTSHVCVRWIMGG